MGGSVEWFYLLWEKQQLFWGVRVHQINTITLSLETIVYKALGTIVERFYLLREEEQLGVHQITLITLSL